ncbi:YbaN family protein [Rheinheimera texasensis]|uniref:YbaN family protein n=1 Tax=Rheinheimera texasensis TaxID=306205 RepID=UPI0032B29A0B
MLLNWCWRLLALGSLALGLIGVLLPGLPTVPFVLLSAFAAGKGWPQFERWLLQHPHFGPPVQQWRQHGAVPRRAKWLASLMMALSLSLLWYSSQALWLQLLVSAILSLVLIWLWRRPER